MRRPPVKSQLCSACSILASQKHKPSTKVPLHMCQMLKLFVSVDGEATQLLLLLLGIRGSGYESPLGRITTQEPLRSPDQVGSSDYSIMFSLLHTRVSVAEGTQIHAGQLDCSIQAKKLINNVSSCAKQILNRKVSLSPSEKQTAPKSCWMTNVKSQCGLPRILYKIE